jgi:enoyl-CoA hydratase
MMVFMPTGPDEGDLKPNEDVLTVSSDGAIRIVGMNRPAALNSANQDLHKRLAEVWPELEADEECRGVVLTGAGRAFSAGGDLGVLRDMHEDVVYREKVLAEGRRIIVGMVRFPWPIVAAVNGPAVGLGCSLAGLSDVVLIEESAYLADPHVSVGLVAGDGGALTWPLLTSLLRAKEYLLTGDRIPALQAVEFGLANRVVPDGKSREEAVLLAKRMAAQPSGALRATKRALQYGLERAVLEVLDFALIAESISSASPEHGAVLARMEKSAARVSK